MNNIKVVNDLDFGKISKALGLIIDPGNSSYVSSVMMNTGQIAYDTQVKRLKIMNSDLISRGLLHQGDVISSITGPSGNIPDASAVLNLVLANQIDKTVGAFDITAPIAEYPKGVAASAVGAIQLEDGSGVGPIIRKGDTWYVKNALIRGLGPGGLIQVKAGDVIISLTDSATNSNSDWLVIEKDLSYATTSNGGIIRLATDYEVLNGSTNTAITPDNLELWRTDRNLTSKFITTSDFYEGVPLEIFHNITGPNISHITKLNGESILLYNITTTYNSITLLSSIDLTGVDITIIG